MNPKDPLKDIGGDGARSEYLKQSLEEMLITRLGVTPDPNRPHESTVAGIIGLALKQNPDAVKEILSMPGVKVALARQPSMARALRQVQGAQLDKMDAFDAHTGAMMAHMLAPPKDFSAERLEDERRQHKAELERVHKWHDEDIKRERSKGKRRMIGAGTAAALITAGGMWGAQRSEPAPAKPEPSPYFAKDDRLNMTHPVISRDTAMAQFRKNPVEALEKLIESSRDIAWMDNAAPALRGALEAAREGRMKDASQQLLQVSYSVRDKAESKYHGMRGITWAGGQSPEEYADRLADNLAMYAQALNTVGKGAVPFKQISGNIELQVQLEGSLLIAKMVMMEADGKTHDLTRQPIVAELPGLSNGEFRNRQPQAQELSISLNGGEDAPGTLKVPVRYQAGDTAQSIAHQMALDLEKRSPDTDKDYDAFLKQVLRRSGLPAELMNQNSPQNEQYMLGIAASNYVQRPEMSGFELDIIFKSMMPANLNAALAAEGDAPQRKDAQAVADSLEKGQSAMKQYLFKEAASSFRKAAEQVRQFTKDYPLKAEKETDTQMGKILESMAAKRDGTEFPKFLEEIARQAELRTLSRSEGRSR